MPDIMNLLRFYVWDLWFWLWSKIFCLKTRVSIYFCCVFTYENLMPRRNWGHFQNFRHQFIKVQVSLFVNWHTRNLSLRLIIESSITTGVSWCISVLIDHNWIVWDFIESSIILGGVRNNFRFLKANYNDGYQTFSISNASGNYLIKECLHQSFLFQ